MKLDTFSKAFTFPNIFFVGFPLLAGLVVVGMRIGGAKDLSPKLLYPMMAFLYGSLFVYVMKALEEDNNEDVMWAGIWGYSAVGGLLLATMIKKYVDSNKSFNRSVTQITNAVSSPFNV